MKILRILPVILSFLLISAHFFRMGSVLLAVALMLFPCLMFIRRPWGVVLIRLTLLAGVIEWIRTLSVLVDMRMAAGRPFTRLAVIIGIVAAVSLLAVFTVPGNSRGENRS